MRTIVKGFQGIAVVLSVWVGYNMLIFGEIAMGHHMKYIPYLHFPIKVFLSFIS